MLALVIRIACLQCNFDCLLWMILALCHYMLIHLVVLLRYFEINAIYVGGRSLGCPENSGGAGTVYDAVPRSLTISNHNLTTDTDTLLLEFPNQPLMTNVYVRNNARASVPLLWSRVQVCN